jgi:hypothetical protein
MGGLGEALKLHCLIQSRCKLPLVHSAFLPSKSWRFNACSRLHNAKALSSSFLVFCDFFLNLEMYFSLQRKNVQLTRQLLAYDQECKVNVNLIDKEIQNVKRFQQQIRTNRKPVTSPDDDNHCRKVSIASRDVLVRTNSWRHCWHIRNKKLQTWY